MMLTLCASCGMIPHVEGQQGFVRYSPPESGVPMSLVPSTSTNADSIGTPVFAFIASLTGATNTRKALTHSATEAHRAMSTLPDDSSPRQLSLFDPIQIPLNLGQIALVDPIDVDLASIKWYAQLATGGSYYAYRTKKPGPMKIYLHRLILSRILDRPLVKGEHTDHINGDKLDNRRANLRVATQAQNNRNVPKPITNKSGLKGVSWDKVNRKWVAQINFDKKVIFLGRYGTSEEAYAAYCEAARKYHGEFARFE